MTECRHCKYLQWFNMGIYGYIPSCKLQYPLPYHLESSFCPSYRRQWWKVWIGKIEVEQAQEQTKKTGAPEIIRGPKPPYLA
jgi:hypothetical protein